MQVNITVKGIDHGGDSKSIKNYIAEHFVKVEDYLAKEDWSPINVDLIANVNAMPHPNHQFEVHIRVPYFSVVVKKEDVDIYKLIDKVINLALDDLRKQKRKLVDERNSGNGFHRP